VSRTSDVVVVGGGVIGCASAWALAREGFSVTLLERDDLAERASGANAGMLLPFGETEREGPFLRWALRGLALFPELCEELRERTGIDPELETSGALHVATDEAAARSLAERAERFAGYGLEWIEAERVRSEEAALSPDLFGAVWSPDEAHVRPPLLTRALAAAAAGLGARIERGVRVTGLGGAGGRVGSVETTGGAFACARVLLCAGAWTPELAPRPLPIVPVRGQLVILDPDAPPLRAIVMGWPTYLVPKRDGSVVVGATEERVGFDERVTAEGVRGLLASAESIAPCLGQAAVRGSWAGLRPATPDGLPLVGALPEHEGAWVAAGHTRNGVLLGPITAHLVRDLLLGKPLPPDVHALSPDRFTPSSPR
jgi:glycine oxidase